jgi:ATP dependent DNA ligase domain
MMARTCAITHFLSARPRWRGCCAIPRPASCSTSTSPRMVLRVRPCVPARCRGHRLCSGLTASRREAARTAILYAFDLIEHDGEDLRNLPFLDRKAALASLLRDTEAGILLNEHLAEDGATVFAHACRLGAEGIVSKKVDGTYQSGRRCVWIKVRNPASIAMQRERREIWNRRSAATA